MAMYKNLSETPGPGAYPAAESSPAQKRVVGGAWAKTEKRNSSQPSPTHGVPSTQYDPHGLTPRVHCLVDLKKSAQTSPTRACSTHRVADSPSPTTYDPRNPRDKSPPRVLFARENRGFSDVPVPASTSSPTGRRTSSPGRAASPTLRSPSPTGGRTATTRPSTRSPPRSPVAKSPKPAATPNGAKSPKPAASRPGKSPARSSPRPSGAGAVTTSTGSLTTPPHAHAAIAVTGFAQEEASVLTDLADGAKAEELWKHLDANGNGIVSLAEVDSLIVNKYPSLNHKPALMKAFQHTTENDGESDPWVHRNEFSALLKNIVFFNKVFGIFDQLDTGRDRRISREEWVSGLHKLGLPLTAEQASDEFDQVANGANHILFDEFCEYVASQLAVKPGGAASTTTAAPVPAPAKGAAPSPSSAKGSSLKGAVATGAATSTTVAAPPAAAAKGASLGKDTAHADSNAKDSSRGAKATTSSTKDLHAPDAAAAAHGTPRAAGGSTKSSTSAAATATHATTATATHAATTTSATHAPTTTTAAAAAHTSAPQRSTSSGLALTHRFDSVEQVIKAGMSNLPVREQLWQQLDGNNSGQVSLAELSAFVLTNWPDLNNKPALMRAFKHTCAQEPGDASFIDKAHFADLMVNVVYFNKAFDAFDQLETGFHDRRLNLDEWKAGTARLGLHLSDAEAEAEFAAMDTNGGGEILFDEFCQWFLRHVSK
eukprot:gnl/Spiro4/5532_TR2809_c0_g1_i1.p1 gnl/Spiro4/5532_TR2809_c0_g1~~gnl/Spiro4/5532_TR2809_c0_g1_i1.p1  ORF type:complete len:713 (-),score=189.32 gnl/Spiro4/5532_TR2809_c0_g1_i1:83-2221(-)